MKCTKQSAVYPFEELGATFLMTSSYMCVHLMWRWFEMFDLIHKGNLLSTVLEAAEKGNSSSTWFWIFVLLSVPLYWKDKGHTLKEISESMSWENADLSLLLKMKTQTRAAKQQYWSKQFYRNGLKPWQTHTRWALENWQISCSGVLFCLLFPKFMVQFDGLLTEHCSQVCSAPLWPWCVFLWIGHETVNSPL